jgi:hypothetical protein
MLCRLMVAAMDLLLHDTSDLQAASLKDGEMSAEPTGVFNTHWLSGSELHIADEAEVFVAGMGIINVNYQPENRLCPTDSWPQIDYSYA